MDRAPRTIAPVRKLQFADSGKLSVRPVQAPVAAPRTPTPGATQPIATQQFSASENVSSFHKLGLFCCCGYLVSGSANDLSMHLLGSKAYLSWIFGLLLLVSFAACGTAMRGTKLSIGKWWLAIAICLVFSAAFSIDRGESILQLESYIPKSLFFYFYCAAFALTLRNCRSLINANILCTSAMLLSAVLFGGSTEGGRFCIPSSLFFGNSNDLAVGLVCSLGFSLFLIWQSSAFARILGFAEFLLTLYFLLKTGSRGGFLALAACMLVWLIFSNKRGSLIALAVPAVCLVLILPGSILSRLVEISATGGSDLAMAMGDDAQSSQFERTLLFQKSVRFAVTHPLLGTGVGTFPDALWLDDVSFGTHTRALGTHNTYTQLASECGLPVFFLYVGILFSSIGMNYRIMKRTQREPGAEKVYTMSVCLLGSLVAYAVASAFDHIAYSATLPLYSAMTFVLYQTSHRGDPRWIEAETAAGNA